MNAGLGNRAQLEGRERMKTCPICPNEQHSLNELHVLMQCSGLVESRKESGIQDFIDKRHGSGLMHLYKEYWNQYGSMDTLYGRIEAAKEMKAAYLQALG